MIFTRGVVLQQLLTLLFTALPVQADQTTFGRIFTTPAQRLVLDEYRENLSSNTSGDERPLDLYVETSKPETISNQVRFSGYMLGNDGKYTLWVDGKSGLGGSSADSVSSYGSLSQNRRDVLFKSQQKQTRLRPGQVWLLDSDEIKEVYQRQPQAPKIKAAVDTNAANSNNADQQ